MPREYEGYDLEAPDLGPCCICERSAPEANVRNIIMLDRRGPIPGRGWGCFVCGLPLDGASAVVCDDCLGDGEDLEPRLRFACRGWAATDGRIPIAELTEPFGHDMSKHPERILNPPEVDVEDLEEDDL